MNVTAISENTIAHPGNREPSYIIVSVTNQNGGPITGLSATNFKVEALIVGPGGAAVDISRVAGGTQGFYYIDVVPVQSYTGSAEPTYLESPLVEELKKGKH